MEMLHKKKIRAISLSSKCCKAGCKCWQPATSTTHLGQELLTNIECSGGSRSFAKETLKIISQPSEVDNDQLRAITEADPLKTTQEVP